MCLIYGEYDPLTAKFAYCDDEFYMHELCVPDSCDRY